ncbi:MAG: zinc metallopeptidase, partial [Coriobacteriales bacterium]
MLFGPGGFAIFIVAMVLGLATQSFVNSAYRRNSARPLPGGLAGSDVARRFLDSEGLANVAIEITPGSLTDHYDPRANVLRLSRDVYYGNNVAAAGVAAHEAGHAVQHARGFAAAKARMALVPAANLGSQAGPVLVMLGLIFGYGGQFS